MYPCKPSPQSLDYSSAPPDKKNGGLKKWPLTCEMLLRLAPWHSTRIYLNIQLQQIEISASNLDSVGRNGVNEWVRSLTCDGRSRFLLPVLLPLHSFRKRKIIPPDCLKRGHASSGLGMQLNRCTKALIFLHWYLTNQTTDCYDFNAICHGLYKLHNAAICNPN